MGRRDEWTEFVKGQTVTAKVRTSKYHAERTTVDGITFDSKKEAARYSELKLLAQVGQIEGLTVQPSFTLMTQSTSGHTLQALRAVAGEFPIIGVYRGDFKYYDLRTCEWVIEDVKGVDTPLSKWKRKHVRAQYGIEVRIV